MGRTSIILSLWYKHNYIRWYITKIYSLYTLPVDQQVLYNIISRNYAQYLGKVYNRQNIHTLPARAGYSSHWLGIK